MLAALFRTAPDAERPRYNYLAGDGRKTGRFNDWPVLISYGWMAVAVGGSAAVGIFFGFYPARKAARLDPIDALRFE